MPLRLAAIEADRAGLAVVEFAVPKHHATLPSRIRLRIIELTPPPVFGLVTTVATVGQVTDSALALIRISPKCGGPRDVLRLEVAAWLDRDMFGLERASRGNRRRRCGNENDQLQLYVRVGLAAVGNRRSRSPDCAASSAQ